MTISTCHIPLFFFFVLFFFILAPTLDVDQTRQKNMIKLTNEKPKELLEREKEVCILFIDMESDIPR